jgi:hypothetical protein
MASWPFEPVAENWWLPKWRAVRRPNRRVRHNAGYVTPVSSPVNMLVMEPGGYAFGDYVKTGLPVLLLTLLVTVALAAVIYPM